MKDMILPYTLPNTDNFWTEECPPGGMSQSSMSFEPDSSVRILNIKIPWLALGAAISHILSYSTVDPVFDPNNTAQQGPYRLKRHLPAKHPQWPNMRATKILSVQGRGPSRTTGGGILSGAVNTAAGVYGNWQYAYLSIQFEVPKYPMLTDNEIRTEASQIADYSIPTTYYPEYRRFHLWEFEPNVETLARKGEQWAFCKGSNVTGQAMSTGDKYLRQAKGTLKITGHQIHEDYIKLGRIIPVNYFKRMGTVNSRPFPLLAQRNQNVAFTGNEYVRFKPGTCLLLAPKIEQSPLFHPDVVNLFSSQNEIALPSYFPHQVDVTTTMIVFDPKPGFGENTKIDLSWDDKYGPGDSNTEVRGHQLVPALRTNVAAGTTTIGWYAIKRVAAQVGNDIPGDPFVDTELLHEYSDFEKLWAPVEFML